MTTRRASRLARSLVMLNLLVTTAGLTLFALAPEAER